jgi:hypothetical protein
MIFISDDELRQVSRYKSYFMNAKAILLILSVALFSSLFMPLFEWNSFEMNGMNYILSTHIPSYKYFLLAVPFSALILFSGAISDENYFFNRKLFLWLPFLTLTFIFIMRYITRNHEKGFYDKSNVFSSIDWGFWITLSFSVLLVFVKSKKKTLFQ